MVQVPANFPRKNFLSQTESVGSTLKLLWFEFRAVVLRLLRWSRDSLAHTRFATRRIGAAKDGQFVHCIAESSTPLWTSTSAGESHLVAGKIQNLRVAAAKLNGLLVQPHEVFSFWAIIGPPTRWRGFVPGRELREGCMVANIGGGLCQLSNALHLNALEAQFTMVERHAHSRVVPGSIAETGKDATVFWNYKDLRFRSAKPFQIEAHLTRTRLIVRFLTTKPGLASNSAQENVAAPHSGGHQEQAHDCVECRHRDCVNFVHAASHKSRTSLLLDSVWPEFDQWLLSRNLAPQDMALVPLNGLTRRVPGYHWFREHPSKPQIREHPLFTAYRSWQSRRLKTQGAARQKALLQMDNLLAQRYSREIPIDCDRLIISSSLLLPLSKLGSLGGREITVLLTRAPLRMLQQTLDKAAVLYPQSPTIRDFRVPSHVVDQELEALHQAHLIVTPHVAVAEFLHREGIHQVQLIPWVLPPPQNVSPSDSGTLLFPASALARKGAYEIRAALQNTGIPLRVLGRAQETADFWGEGINLETSAKKNPFERIAAVVLPSHLENQPRILLQALASGIPVIATQGCGIPHTFPGIHLIPPGDSEQLALLATNFCSVRSILSQKEFSKDVHV